MKQETRYIIKGYKEEEDTMDLLNTLIANDYDDLEEEFDAAIESITNIKDYSVIYAIEENTGVAERVAWVQTAREEYESYEDDEEYMEFMREDGINCIEDIPEDEYVWFSDLVEFEEQRLYAERAKLNVEEYIEHI